MLILISLTSSVRTPKYARSSFLTRICAWQLTALRHESRSSAQWIAYRLDVDGVPERKFRDSVRVVLLSLPIFLAAILTIAVSNYIKRSEGKQDAAEPIA